MTTSRHQEVDEVVVARLLRGERGLNPTRAEMTAATAVLMGEQKSASEIADRLGCSSRSVERYRRDVRAGRFAGLGGITLLAKGAFPGHLSIPGVILLSIVACCVLAAILIVFFGRR